LQSQWWYDSFAKKTAMEREMVLKTISLEYFDTSLSEYRLVFPSQIKAMKHSFERVGQLQPVITRQSEAGYQLIDGFKRYYAAEQLALSTLLGKVLDVSESVGKAMILAYNKESSPLVDYEEGLIVCSLKNEHGMNQKQIAELTGYSAAWVCRRISLVERLDETVQSQLTLGKISAAHAREIIKLPRGNQGEVTRSIMEHDLSSRSSAWLIDKYLSSGSKAQKQYLLDHPLEAIEKQTKETEIYDSRLGKHGNKLLKTTELLHLQQNIFAGQYNHIHTVQLSDLEKGILRPTLRKVCSKARLIVSLIDQKEPDDER
jgi:ParB family transcriptional regulator, chromosome partitioning protein